MRFSLSLSLFMWLVSTDIDCAGGAAGAAGASVLGVLLDFGDKDKNKDGRISDDEKLTSEQRNAQSALLQALVAGLGALTGTDGTELASAVTSAQSEAENNSIGTPGSPTEIIGVPCVDSADNSCSMQNWRYLTTQPLGAIALMAAGGNLLLYERCLGSSNADGCAAYSARYQDLVDSFGESLRYLSWEEITRRGEQISSTSATLDELFGDNEVEKDKVRRAIAQGHVPEGALENILALKQWQDCEASIACRISQFASDHNPFASDTKDTKGTGVPPKKPDPKDPSYIVSLGVAILGGTTAPDPDQDDGYNDPANAPSRASPSASQQWAEGAGQKLADGVTQDGQQIYRDGNGNRCIGGG